MAAQSQVHHYVHVMRHFVSTRSIEVLALQASPILGIFFSGFSFAQGGVIRPGVLLLGSLALTAHVFVFNDWAGFSSDSRDPQRAALVFTRHGISRDQVALVALALLIFANVAFASIGAVTIVLGAAIAALSLLYSYSPIFGKSTPIMASINHLLGGALHFLLGYTAFHTLDADGLMISLFFGLVFAGGHLNQEVRDYEGDRLNGIRTSAVVFGARRTLLASLAMFTVAYALLTSLAARDVLPKLLLGSPILWMVHIAWSVQALQRGLGFDTALWLQRRYRLLFALVGLALLAG